MAVSRAARSATRANNFKQRVFDWGQRSPRQNVAYFCMEFGLASNLPIYSGGLGILAGDTVKSAADLGVPMTAVGFLYRDGYFMQEIKGGQQKETWQRWSPNRHEGLIDLRKSVSLEIAEQEVNFRLWGYEVKGLGGDFVPLILLDSRGAKNPPGYAEITSQLYAKGDMKRLFQEMALGIGGVRALKWLGLPIAYYHLNEGHAAFATVEVLSRLGKSIDNISPDDIQSIRNRFSFTTHTPVPAGFDRFHVGLIEDAFSDPFLRAAVLAYGRDRGNPDLINMASLAMRLSAVRNGVSRLHAEVSEEMFPEHTPIIPITNGVHHLTWVAKATADFLDEFCPGWKKHPAKLEELLALKKDSLFRNDLWKTHIQNKHALLKTVEDLTGIKMAEDVFTIGFARRFATYKRGNLIFENENELLRVAEEIGGLQLIFAGKAHPADMPGKALIAKTIEAGNRLMAKSKGKIKFAFLPNYNMDLGAAMTAGVDSWLNTPLPPREASGTSGMKAALNAVPHISTEDGWWVENRGGGWTIGDKDNKIHDGDLHLYLADSASLYKVLAEAGKAFNDRFTDSTFVDMMVEALAGNGAFFNTQRMVEEYVANMWVTKTGTIPPPSCRAAEPIRFAEILQIFGRASYKLGLAANDDEIEATFVNSIMELRSGCFRITRYDAHHESVRREKRWSKERHRGIIGEENRAEMGSSGFDHWKKLTEFSGEVMADLLRTREIQAVVDPEKDPRCHRDGKLVSANPFILIPEIVNGEIRGAYKLDFHPGELKGRSFEEHIIKTLITNVGEAKALQLAKALAKDLAGLETENEVLNWALTLMTGGGFVDMPRYAVETNRVAIFRANDDGELVGTRAVGDTSLSEFNTKLGAINSDLHRDGVQTHLRRLDQSNSSLSQHIKGKSIGFNVIGGPIQVKDGWPEYDHTEFNGAFDSRKLSAIKDQTEALFAVEGREIKDYLLLPILGPTGRPYGLVYVDNAFSNNDLAPALAKYQAIIQAAVGRIIEIRKASAKAKEVIK
ncbi:MAG: alpha-glucan family phosphorylase [Candidatus Margulisiibacteriota bacterium]